MTLGSVLAEINRLEFPFPSYVLIGDPEGVVGPLPLRDAMDADALRASVAGRKSVAVTGAQVRSVVAASRLWLADVLDGIAFDRSPTRTEVERIATVMRESALDVLDEVETPEDALRSDLARVLEEVAMDRGGLQPLWPHTCKVLQPDVPAQCVLCLKPVTASICQSALYTGCGRFVWQCSRCAIAVDLPQLEMLAMSASTARTKEAPFEESVQTGNGQEDRISAVLRSYRDSLGQHVRIASRNHHPLAVGVSSRPTMGPFCVRAT